MNILCVGDIVGQPGREAFAGLIGKIKKEHTIDFVIVNAENAAGGAGLTSKIADELLSAGADVITLGDHVWDQKELEEYLKTSDKVIRPANFPEGAPGKGWCVKQAPDGTKVCVVNLLGRIFMRYSVECPFKKMEEILEELKGQDCAVVVDFHAEATSEKVALGHFLNGKVAAVVGTHTHIQTADEKVLSGSTAYITDLGMSGPYDSVIGQDKERIIERFLTSMPIRFSVAKGDVALNAVVVKIDNQTKKALSIKRLQVAFEANG